MKIMGKGLISTMDKPLTIITESDTLIMNMDEYLAMYISREGYTTVLFKGGVSIEVKIDIGDIRDGILDHDFEV